MSRDEDEKWMRECLRLAKKGVGRVSPNPLVGAVIVRGGRAIGKGYHRSFGEAHAEVNAIRDALRRGSDVNGATLYVNLEPCSHQGKTPPCVSMIIKHRIGKVVAGMEDPNPLVAGRGFAKLRRFGVKVTSGVLRSQAATLNEKFIKYITTGIPFVGLKVARTSDGFIARTDGSSKWITNKRSRTLAHVLRREYDAVLVGAGTVALDNPKLTVRHVRGRNPLRVVIDGRLRSPLGAHLYNDADRKKTIVFASRPAKGKVGALRKKGVHVVVMKGKKVEIPVKHILKWLAERGIASVMVEGGRTTYGHFLDARAVDTIHMFVSPKIFVKGILAFDGSGEQFALRRQRVTYVGRDTLIEGRVAYGGRK